MWMKKDVPLYGFAIFDSQGNCTNALKTILCTEKIVTTGGVISIYSPYKELARIIGKQMWGVGFSLSALNSRYNLLELDHSNGTLRRCIINSKEIDLKDFNVKDNDYFVVTPKGNEMRELCFREKVPTTKYYYWRCKGISFQYCESKIDAEITKYLNEGYRFDRRNFIPVSRKDFFKSEPLFERSIEYKWLNLSCEELKNRSASGKQIYSGGLL